jgi:hypothetical protein
MNLDSFSLYRYIVCYHPLRHSRLQIFYNASRKGFSVHKRIMSAFRWVQFLSGRMSCIILRRCCCDVRSVFLKLHAPSEDKSDVVKDIFYEEIGRIFDQFPRYDMIMFLEYTSKHLKNSCQKLHAHSSQRS